MSSFKKSILFFLSLITKISKEVWSFFIALFVFIIIYVWINSNVEHNNIMALFGVVSGNIITTVVAIQTLPSLFFEMFTKNKDKN